MNLVISLDIKGPDLESQDLLLLLVNRSWDFCPELLLFRFI